MRIAKFSTQVLAAAYPDAKNASNPSQAAAGTLVQTR